MARIRIGVMLCVSIEVEAAWDGDGNVHVRHVLSADIDRPSVRFLTDQMTKDDWTGLEESLTEAIGPPGADEVED